MFLVKRIVGLRVLYIYSFAFDLVELGECTRIRGRKSSPDLHASPLCCGAFDLHLLDFNRRTHLAIGIAFAELGQDVALLSL